MFVLLNGLAKPVLQRENIQGVLEYQLYLSELSDPLPRQFRHMRQRSFFDGASGCVFAKRLHQPNGRGARVVDQNGRLFLRQGRRSVENQYKEVERYDE